MTKNKRIYTPPTISMRFSPDEKRALRKLSSLLKLSQTETVRVLVHERLASYSLVVLPKTTAMGQEPKSKR